MKIQKDFLIKILLLIKKSKPLSIIYPIITKIIFIFITILGNPVYKNLFFIVVGFIFQTLYGMYFGQVHWCQPPLDNDRLGFYERAELPADNYRNSPENNDLPQREINTSENYELPATESNIPERSITRRISNPSHYAPNNVYNENSMRQDTHRYIPYQTRGTTGVHEMEVDYSEVNSMEVNLSSRPQSDIYEIGSISTESGSMRVNPASSTVLNGIYEVNYHSNEYNVGGDLPCEPKLGFGYANSSFYKIYLKIHDKSKRKFYWTIWEKDRKTYSTYSEFKKEWNVDTNIWKEIKNTIKKDLKSEINELIRVKDPFKSPLNGNNPLSNIRDREHRSSTQHRHRRHHRRH
jgi:hypothetical protein